MPLTCSRHSRHVYACPHIFRFRMRRKLPLHRFAPHGSGFLPSRVEPHSLNSLYPSRRGGYRARTVKPSHMSPPRGQSLPAATHSEAVSYSCNAALAVGISFLVGCNPKLVCPGDADAIQRRYSASFWRYTDAMMLLRVGSWPKPGLIPTPSPLSVVSSPRHAILPSLRNFNVVNRPCLAPETTLTNVLYIIF